MITSYIEAHNVSMFECDCGETATHRQWDHWWCRKCLAYEYQALADDLLQGVEVNA